eukprot:9441-Heterococcus_DN1.PRE.1
MVAAATVRAAILALLPCAAAHSWIACTDVQGIRDKQQAPRGRAEDDAARLTYDDSKCHGYARGWHRYVTPAFGVDMGYNYQTKGGPLCQWGADDYSAQYGRATYKAGDTICIQHPSKNHVATEANIWMPDTSMKVYRTQGPGQNPTDIANMVELFVHDGAHVKGVVDYKGYQNCPGFMENNDKAVCTACFDLGQTTQEGIYGLAWVWTFNELETPYTTCWDAFIGVGGVPSAKVNTATVTNIAPVAQQQQQQQQQQLPQQQQQQQQYSNNGQAVPVPATSNTGSQGHTDGSQSSSGAACDAKCEHGILDYKTGACCAAECGECGGEKCHEKQGGVDCCCATLIVNAGKSCEHNVAPCVVYNYAHAGGEQSQEQSQDHSQDYSAPAQQPSTTNSQC